MKFKIGDRVIVEKSNIESICKCAGKTGTIVEGPVGRTFVWSVLVDGYLAPYWCDVKCIAEDTKKQNKIVITHDAKTTTATLYREDGSKEVATAKCCPEDTFDFNVGAKLAMERLMKKVEPVEEWRVVNRKPKIGDFIRLKYATYSFDKDGDIHTVHRVHEHYLEIHQNDYSSPDAHRDDRAWTWTYTNDNYEVVERVTTTEPKKPEPPKYFTGKAICIREDICWWTKGKIYEFVDGRTTDDEGDFRRYTCNQYNFNQIFLPIVE
jgi:hypothetical protein